jgi:transcriptional regulator of acetoin/glycerol metabolism
MGPQPSITAPADLAAARRRSALSGIDPGASEVPQLGDPPPSSSALRQLSAPVLDELVTHIADTPLAVILADRTGRVIHRDAAMSATLAAMDDRSVDVGFSLAETDVGTNGVGTSLEAKRPAMVIGDDHFLRSFQPFTCANAPVVDPITHRVEGTVGVLCPVEETTPLLLPTALQLSAQIGELLLERATPDERVLLEQFLRRRRGTKRAIATIGAGVFIATPAAQRLLEGVDHAGLWEEVEAAVRESSSATIDIERPSGGPLHLRCRPVYRAGEIGGATVEFAATRHRTRRRRTDKRLGTLIGDSAPWRTMVADALQAARLDEPVLIAGERGTGRLSVATAIAELRESEHTTVFDSASVLVDGAREWVLDATDALVADATFVIRRIDQLPDDVAAALAAAVNGAPTGTRVIATTERTTAAEPGLAALLDQLDVLRIDVPPLRDRRDDIAALVGHFGAAFGRRRIDPEVIKVLYRQAWPGNVTELQQALRAAHATASTDALAVRHLARHLRDDQPRRPLAGLRQQEAEAIVTAIQTSATRAEAAERLGISRATLYRRIDAYGLDVD